MTTTDKNINHAVYSEESRRDLAAGVLKQAAHDLRRFHGATSRLGQELYLDAYSWVTANEFSWPFSFLNVCQTLNLVPNIVREELMSDFPLGTVRSWARRCMGAALRLGSSFGRRFSTDPAPPATNTLFRTQPVQTFAYESTN